MRRCVAGVVTVLLGAGLAACSSDGGAGSSAATTSAATSSTATSSTAASSSAASSSADLCASADAMRSSLASLGDVQVVQDGVDALSDAWTTAQGAWAQLADDAKAQYADEVDGVQADADAVESAIASAQNDPTAQTLGDAATAVGAFLQDAGALTDEVESTC
jgi:hypothetical protein